MWYMTIHLLGHAIWGLIWKHTMGKNQIRKATHPQASVYSTQKTFFRWFFWIFRWFFWDFSVKFLSLWRGLWWWLPSAFSHNSVFHSVGLPITLLTYHCHCPSLWISIEGPLCSAATDIVRDKQITLLPYLIIMSSILPLTWTFVTLYQNVFECSLSGGHE